jgi:hypothetical protein
MRHRAERHGRGVGLRSGRADGDPQRDPARRKAGCRYRSASGATIDGGGGRRHHDISRKTAPSSAAGQADPVRGGVARLDYSQAHRQCLLKGQTRPSDGRGANDRYRAVSESLSANSHASVQRRIPELQTVARMWCSAPTGSRACGYCMRSNKDTAGRILQLADHRSGAHRKITKY